MIKKTMTLLLILLVFSGCTQLKFSNSNLTSIKEYPSSCEEEAKPKSLQFLEQQYRCTSK